MSDKYLTAYEKVLDRPSLKFMLGESKKREQELKADHVSKKALREWCENIDEARAEAKQLLGVKDE